MVGSKDLEPSHTKFFPNVFFNNQFRAKPDWPAPGTTLSGKTAIITGGNTGLGYETAVQLLELRISMLVLAVRSPEKGEAAADTLRKQHPGSTIQVWLLDMDSYDSITGFVQRVERSLSRIDMVLLNAGTPHLTIVNAALSLVAAFPGRSESPLFSYFKDSKHWSREEHYNTSKLLAHAFLWNLTDYVSADDVIVNLADPAWVKGTALARETQGAMKIGLKIFELTGRTPRVGASCFVDAMVNKGKESHGCFLMSWKIHPFAALLYTPEGRSLTKRVWEETLAELEFAGVGAALDGMRV